MATKAKRRKIKARAETVKVTVTLPEKTYILLKDFAKEEIRSIPQEARYLIELGMQVLSQQGELGGEAPIEEGEPCIGFRMPPRDEEDYDDEDEE